jgi:phosphoribosylaminoimidazole-succinocarboxamide synthase
MESFAMTEFKPIKEGKVREIYDNGDSLIMVATDRISAFDVILKNKVTNKGKVLTQMSKFWFDYTRDVLPNHMLSVDTKDMPEFFQQPQFEGKCMKCRKLTMLPIECIVRGYITGSGWASYQQNGTVCGIQLPEGLTEASKLPEPLFTPSTKAEIGDHDENISFERCCEIVGEDIATQIRDLSLKIYKAAAEYAATRGIIIADTKFEFGVIDGKVTLIDECLTPDSSRFWPAASYEEGKIQPSYDKQFVRNWLKANWDMTGETPHLPAEVIDGTSERYREAFQIITGSQFTSMKENA